MKNIIKLVLAIFISTGSLFGQHSVSITGGWTFSTFYKTGTEEAFELSSYNREIFDFSLFHAPSINAKYEFNHRSFRLSTGLSFLSIGARDYFWEGTELAYLYLTIPVLFGFQSKLSKNFSLVVEGGAEIGTSIMNVGSVIILGRKEGRTRPYLGLCLGIEGSYKRLSLGTRLHLGLNNFEEWIFTAEQETLYFKHIGATVYLGYKLWDLQKARERRQNKLQKRRQ